MRRRGGNRRAGKRIPIMAGSGRDAKKFRNIATEGKEAAKMGEGGFS